MAQRARRVTRTSRRRSRRPVTGDGATTQGRAARLRHALPVWLALNAAAALAIGHAYVSSAGVTPAWDAALYAHVAFAAAVFTSTALLGAPGGLLTFLPGGIWLVGVLSPVMAVPLLAFLWVDRAAFATYRFHVGGLAWNAFGVPGPLSDLGIRPASPWALVAVIVVLAVLDGLLLQWLARRPAGHTGRRWLLLATAALTLVVAERALFHAADRSGRRDVVRMINLVPFYPTLVGSDLARAAPALTDALSSSAEPPSPPPPPVAFRPDAPRWNVLWIVLDSWRADAMTPELTPVVTALARRSTTFRSHTSGGDSTRYGIVSMFYGVPASTWSRLELEHRHPPFLATLRDRGWDLGVFTSVDMPDVLSVVFGDVPDASRLATPPGSGAEKDRLTIRNLERFVATPRDGRPFFAFVHLISTHAPYDATCRLPVDTRGPRARYERAIRCADRLVARALRAVSLANTIVLVTADHGEAFGEQGIFGHSAGFTLPQLRVPLVLHVPGRAPATIDYPTTHHDLVATLLDALGAPDPGAAAGIGRSLFDGHAATRLFACNMNECAIHDADGSVTFGIGARFPRELQIRDRAGAPVPASGDIGRRRVAQVMDLLALQRSALP